VFDVKFNTQKANPDIVSRPQSKTQKGDATTNVNDDWTPTITVSRDRN